ncbi:hypothetical protein JKF63_00238 [Porcisia hertigi]|uniref:Cullin neddylation domain-containing protein n=1 Tax=Porcisia hertigi TaxID=2761500 RepID=A0A836HER8_9TRYP|nr:hypothetical protein JKF63_00238 [Porcisia hertigi]
MTVPLGDLTQEWEVVNAELYRASLASHRRYPFLPDSDGGSDDINYSTGGPPSPNPPPSSTTTHAHVYNLLSRVRHVAEDARYNSFHIVQNLLWVTIVAWANHLAIASNNLIRLPMNMRQYDSASTPEHRISFPCDLLPHLEFWDPGVLGQMSSVSSRKPGGNHDAFLHQVPNLSEAWSNAVKRIFEVWCSKPSSGSRTEATQLNDPRSAQGNATPSAIHYAHVWVTVARHFRRFKSLLSLFFLRYDALLEEREEQLHWGGRRRLQRPQTNRSRTPQRHGGPLLASSSNSASAPATLSTDKEAALKKSKPAHQQRCSHFSIPSTVNLLRHLMRSIANENLSKICEVTNDTHLSFLLPPVLRRRLRHHNTLPVSGAGEAGQLGPCAPTQDNATPDEANLAKETPLTSSWRSAERLDDDGDEDDDRVLWSSPPSPLFSYTARTTCRAGQRVQPEEYVIRNFFKLLLMIEDCRAHVLHRRLLEHSKRVASFYGSQLATNLSDDAAVQPSVSIRDASETPQEKKTAAKPRSLAHANRVLREVLQAYLRLRTRLLFLNAGTTHFLDTLSPWGQTHMLESLNAFLCGLCTPTSASADQVQGKSASTLPRPQATQVAASSLDNYNNPTLCTAMNSAVAEFVQKWSVPLWIVMCVDAQQRMEALKRNEDERARRLEHRAAAVEDTHRCTIEPAEYQQRLQPRPAMVGCSEGKRCVNDPWHSGHCSADPSLAIAMCSLTSGAGGAGGDDCANKLATCDRDSVASTELEDAVSRTTTVIWPPRSPSVANGGAEGAGRPFTRRRGRGLDLKYVLHQEQQRCARLGCVKLPRRGVTASRNCAAVVGSRMGRGDVAESLYTGETTSVDENDSSFAALAEAEDNGTDAGVARHSFSATETEERQRIDGQCLTTAGSPRAKCFSLSAQLHQVATTPDEGFPSLLYLLPRGSRCVVQVRTAAAVQQQLFKLFSANVQLYLTDYLAECETAAAAAADQRASLASQTRQEKKAQATILGGNTNARTSADSPIDALTPLPQSVLARMTFLLEMTYAALRGHNQSDSKSFNDHTKGNDVSGNGASPRPLMETDFTANWQEPGAAILEQCSGEFDFAMSTTLSGPTSPAQLTIAAVRKGFQGFLTSVEKRAVLALAQALYGLVQQGVAQQPPAAQLDPLDTILNMASMLNCKDKLVLLLKGYLAPQVIMCRSKSELVVMRQVADRMAYRLGTSVAAPCLALLRNIELFITDPRITTHPLSPCGTPAPTDPEGDLEPKAAYERSMRGNKMGDSDQWRRASGKGTAAENMPPVAVRDAKTLVTAIHQHHGSFGLIHRVHILCEAWWKPHTAVLVSSQRLCELWERHQLLDERILDAVLSFEWRYQGHSESFCGYRQLAKLREKSDRSLSDAPEAGYSQRGSESKHSGILAAGTQQRTVTAAAVVRGFSSALGNAVRCTGHQASDFGYSDTDNESEDYREAYGGLLTLSTLQRHHSAHALSDSSYRGSNLSSMGDPGAGGSGGAGREHWGTSDGRQSTIADDRTSTTVPVDGQLEPRRLRWSLGDGQLAFYFFSSDTASTGRRVSQAVQILGPPLTLLVCQLLDRASGQLYTFNTLYKAIPVATSKPLLAHLLHELVKAKVVVRSVAAGTRKLTYRLCDSVREIHQCKVVVDVSAVAQQEWVKGTMDTVIADASPNGETDSAERGSARVATPPANPREAAIVFPGQLPRAMQQAHLNAAPEAKAAPSLPINGTSPRAYSSNYARKIEVCIVRMMKSERVLSHRELLERITVALEDEIVVTPSQFKRCVTRLIEKELLQRGEKGEYIFVS